MKNDEKSIADKINDELKEVKEKCLIYFASQWKLSFSEPFSQELVDILNSLSATNKVLTDPYYYSYLDYQNNVIIIDTDALDKLFITKKIKYTEEAIKIGREIHIAIQMIKRIVMELLPQSSKLDKKITELLSCFIAYDILELDVLKESRSWNFWEYLDSNKIESKYQTDHRYQPLIFYTYAYLLHLDINKVARLSTRLLHWAVTNQPLNKSKYKLLINQIYEQSQEAQDHRSTYWLYADLRNFLSSIIQSPQIINSLKKLKEFNSKSLSSELSEPSLKSSLQKVKSIFNPVYLNYISYGLLEVSYILLKIDVEKNKIKSRDLS